MTTILAASGGAVQVDLLVVLACAGLVSLFLSRFRVAVIPAYLLTGMAIGPSGLGIVSSPERVEQLGELALIVLMFSIGMHLDSSSLRRGAVSIISIGLLSTLTATGLIAGALSATPLHASAAIAIGMALSMSSTAVVLQLLTQRRKLQTTTGRASLGVLLTQDLLAIVYLAVMPVIAHAYGLGVTAEETGDATARIGRLAMAIGGVSALIVVGRLMLPRLLREASRVGGSEVMLVLTAAVGLGAATLTAGLGLSAELGAFTAGFLLAGTPFRYQLSGQLAPVRDLFMAVFFTAVGLQVDLDAVLPMWWVVPVGAVALILLKAVNIAVVAWAVGAESALAVRLGVALSQAGEFSLVVLAIAGEVGLVGTEEISVVIAVVIATLILTPTVMGTGSFLGSFVQRFVGPAPWRRSDELGEDKEEGGHHHSRVIVAGFGLVGRTCVERLEAAGVSCTIIEMNPTTVREQTALGRRVIFGDVANPDVLETAGAEHAEAVVLSLPDSDATMQAVRTLRQLRQDLPIAVRVSMERRAPMARELGATLVVVEETVSAVVLADEIINRCGFRKPAEAEAQAGP